jgi:hypothetical protein
VCVRVGEGGGSGEGKGAKVAKGMGEGDGEGGRAGDGLLGEVQNVSLVLVGGWVYEDGSNEGWWVTAVLSWFMQSSRLGAFHWCMVLLDTTPECLSRRPWLLSDILGVC